MNTKVVSGTVPKIEVRKQQNAGYFGAFFSLGLIVVAIGPALPYLASQTDSQLHQVSYIFAARSLGFIIGSMAIGRVYDRIRGHPLLVFGMIMLATLSGVIPFIPWLWVLVVLFFGQGLFGSAVSVGASTLLVWANRRFIGHLLGGLHFIWGVGAFLSPIVVIRLIEIGDGIGLAFVILSLLSLPVCLWLIRLPSPSSWIRPQEEVGEEEGGPTKTSLAVMIWFFLVVYTGTEAGIGNWIFTYAIRTGLADATTAAYLNSAFWGTLTIGRLAAIPLTTRLRPRTILLIDLCGALLGILLITIFDGSDLILWTGVCLTGLSMASVFPTTIYFAERRITLSGKLTGVLYAGSSTGSMLIPWIIGQFFESRGPKVLLWIAIVGLVIEFGIFSMMMFFPRQRRRTGKKIHEVHDVAVKHQ